MPKTLALIAVPCVMITIDAQSPRTTRTRYVPRYEERILRLVWPKADISVRKIPEDLPESMRFRNTTLADEARRLRSNYPNGAFDHAFPAGTFEAAFNDVLPDGLPAGDPGVEGFDETSGAQVQPHPATVAKPKSAPAPEPKSAPEPEPVKRELSPAAKVLTEIRGLGPELAEALVESGIDTIADVAMTSTEELESYPGIGPASAAKILASAQELATVTAEPEAEDL